MSDHKVLPRRTRLKKWQREATEYTWRVERFDHDIDAPKLNSQQYVLFDEAESWPAGEDWP